MSDEAYERARKAWLDADGTLEDFESIAGPPSGGVSEPPRVWTPADLYNADLPSPEGFLLDRIFCRGSINMVAGRRGVGKSWLLLKLWASIATTSFFGHMTVKGGRSLFLSQELTESEVQERLRQVFTPVEAYAEALNVNGRIICRADWHADSDGGAHKLRHLADGYDAVIFDSWSDIKGTVKENDNDLTGEAARRVRDSVAIPLGCAVVFSHHMGRAKEDGSTNPRGASALEDVAADIIHLGRARDRNDFVGHFEKVRHMSPPRDFGYSISGETEDKESVSVNVYDIPETQASEAQEVKKVVSFIGETAYVTTQEVMKKMSWSKMAAMRYLKLAQEFGFIEKHKVGGQDSWRKTGVDKEALF